MCFAPPGIGEKQCKEVAKSFGDAIKDAKCVTEEKADKEEGEELIPPFFSIKN